MSTNVNNNHCSVMLSDNGNNVNDKYICMYAVNNNSNKHNNNNNNNNTDNINILIILIIIIII